MTRVRSRFFVIGTLLFMALLAGYIVLQALVLGRATTTVKVGFVGQAQVLAQPLTAAAGPENVKVERNDPADIRTGEDKVRNGSLDALISGDPASPQVEVKDDLNPTLAATLNAIVKQVALNRALTVAGADPTAVESAVSRASIQLVYLDPNAALKAQQNVVGIFVAALLYAALVVYGQIVAAGVVEEKANRIIEILLATVRPRQLLLGKVIGIGLRLPPAHAAGSDRACGGQPHARDQRSQRRRHRNRRRAHVVRARLHPVRAGLCGGRFAGLQAGGPRIGDQPSDDARRGHVPGLFLGRGESDQPHRRSALDHSAAGADLDAGAHGDR